MLTIYTLIPFLLELGTNISNPFQPEYLFDLKKTTVVYREPLQTTYFTTRAICQPFSTTTLHCLLQNVTFLTTLKYKNMNFTEEISKEHIKFERFFEILFDKSGVKNMRLYQLTQKEEEHDKLIESTVKDIANGLNINSEVITILSSMPFKSDLTKPENTPIGTCTTKYSTNVINKDDEEQLPNFQIMPLALASQLGEVRNAHVYIKKNRQNCDYFQAFDDFLNGMEVSKYDYKMEIVRDKLNISTTMDVRLPADLWNTHGSPVFTETTSLNLTIRALQKVLNSSEFSITNSFSTIPIL